MEKTEKNILIACTGSVATIKLPLLVDNILKLNEESSDVQYQVKVIVTEHAQYFFKPDNVKIQYFIDRDEWDMWTKRGDPVLHIELGKWADIMVIAPLDANTLAKMAQGICDNLLLCTTRAWDIKKPLLFCPAMNTRMWEHPITAQHIETLKKWGHIEVPCITKTLMCGDTGNGAMAEVDTIIAKIIENLN